MNKNVYVVIDGQAGSCGKGKVIGELAIEQKIDVAITNCMPNAGHTFQRGGKKRIFHNIPVSSVNPNTFLLMGPGSVINLNVLEKEYEDNKDLLEGRTIIAHPNIPIIKESHIEYEKEIIKSGSTYQGCAPCQSEKLMRNPETQFFKEYKNIRASLDYYKILFQALKEKKKILLEGAQGCDLDLNHSGFYPHTSSRQVSVAQLLADSGISPYYLKKVIMVIRPFPIRISNESYDGTFVYSGPYAQELTWDQINVGSYLGQYPNCVDEELINEYKNLCPDLSEFTTVTKKKRRIFDLNLNNLIKNIMINKPDEIYLNFFQQLDGSLKGISGYYDGKSDIYLDKYRREYLRWLETILEVPITKLGTGAENGEYINRVPLLRTLKR